MFAFFNLQTKQIGLNVLLNDREKKFCEEFAVSGNGTQSAIRAGYSKKNAGNTSSLLLKKSKIIKYIDEIKKPQDEARKNYIELINDSREYAAEKLISLMDCPIPAIAMRACENVLRLDKIPDKPLDDKPTVKIEFV